MSRHITVEAIGKDIVDAVNLVGDGNEPLIIDKDGAPIAVLISPEQYERYRDQIDKRFREAVAELRRRNADRDPDQVLRDVTAAVKDVRRERNERERACT
jgi:PHD/YefM family antitoxin component YafN of YafNO toxin-antitoxin module